MITKAELKRYIRLQDQKDDLAKQIVLLRTMAESVSAITYDGIRVQSPYNGSSQDKYTEKYMEQIDNLTARYKYKINELTTLQHRIEDEISVLSDEDQRLIRLRYFEDLSCRECAKRLHVSESTFHRWHREVLNKLRNE